MNFENDGALECATSTACKLSSVAQYKLCMCELNLLGLFMFTLFLFCLDAEERFMLSLSECNKDNTHTNTITTNTSLTINEVINKSGQHTD